MATTTNFGWETPDDTDLVKDGAAAIRTALGGVDTSFVDLKGGTTGQVLSKASGTDLDFSWATPASGSTFSGAAVSNSTNPSIAHNTLTTLAFNTETYDTNGYHDNATNNSRITIPTGKGGYYLITAQVQYDVNSSGRRELYIAKNGTLIGAAEATASSAAYPKPLYSYPAALAAGDYVEVKLYQSSGISLTAFDNLFAVSYLGA